MKNLLLCLLSLIPFTLFAQGVKLVNQVDTTFANPEEKFIYLSAQDSLLDFTYIATYMADRYELTQSFYILKKKAVKLGANAFRVKKEDKSRGIIWFEVYHIADSTVLKSMRPEDNNLIYVFSGNSKKTSFRLNGKKIRLAPNEFFKYRLKKEEKLKLNKGGALGTTVRIRWEEHKAVRFLSLRGFSGSSGSEFGQQGITINTGRIWRIAPDLGYLLLDFGVAKTIDDFK